MGYVMEQDEATEESPHERLVPTNVRRMEVGVPFMAAPRIIQVRSSHDGEGSRGELGADNKNVPSDIFGSQTLAEPEQRSRTLTPDAMNMEALLQSGYLSQTFSTEGGATMGSTRDHGTMGSTRDHGTMGSTRDHGSMGSTLFQSGTLKPTAQDSPYGETGTLRRTGTGLGTTFGTTMTEDSLEVAAAKNRPLQKQKTLSITLPPMGEPGRTRKS